MKDGGLTVAVDGRKRYEGDGAMTQTTLHLDAIRIDSGTNAVRELTRCCNGLCRNPFWRRLPVRRRVL